MHSKNAAVRRNRRARIATGIVSFVTETSVFVMDDPAATAVNLVRNQAAFRVGVLADLLSGASYLALTGLLHHLLKPASRIVSSIAAIFGFGGIAISSVAYAAHFAPVLLLGSGDSLAAFSRDQLQGLSLAAVNLQIGAFTMALFLFGVQCMLAGVLIARSRFLPAALGVLLAFGGSAYAAASAASILSPAVAKPLEDHVDRPRRRGGARAVACRKGGARRAMAAASRRCACHELKGAAV